MRDLAGFRPHKSKGQNFLTQPRIADRIAAAARLESSDNVVEIGPGLGILSEAIIRHGVHSLTMIELDKRLATVLQDRMLDRHGVNVINADFLDLRGLPGDGPLKVVANLPFNVASAILERLCADHARITLMVLMFQREVAERIRARPGDSDYGALSVYTALYWNVTDHFRVAAGILILSPRSTRRFSSSRPVVCRYSTPPTSKRSCARSALPSPSRARRCATPSRAASASFQGLRR